jgi:hypothetical protein
MFALRDIREQRFGSFDELLRFTKQEKGRIVRIPLRGLWDGGARFQDDATFGIASSAYGLNADGFRAVCNLIGIDDRVMRRLQGAELATDILNDLLKSTVEGLGQNSTPELVIDEETSTVIGVVSKRYVGYSNDAFIDDVLSALSGKKDRELFPDLGDLEFKEAFSINSRLHLRLVSKTIQGKVTGRGGTGEDVSEIGVELRNSMAGGQAVRLSWFVFRLICANGLIAKAAGHEGRVVHSGSEKSFLRKLYGETEGVVGGLRKAATMIKTLGGIAFDPEKLAKYADQAMIFGIVSDRDLKSELKSKIDPRRYDKLSIAERKQRQKTDELAQLPFCIGGTEAIVVFRSYFRDGASMYDFINVFTEYAKGRSLTEKTEIENKAGELASWINNNKRKFI